MNIIPEYFVMQFGLKIQLTPMNIAMLVALGLCVAVVWRWARKRT